MQTITVNGKPIEYEEWEILEDYYDEEKEREEYNRFLPSDLEYQDKMEWLESRKIKHIESKLKKHVRKIIKQREEENA